MRLTLVFSHSLNPFIHLFIHSFIHRFCSASECKRVCVSEIFSPPHDLKHLQLCAIESMIQLTASNLLQKLHFKSRATRLYTLLCWSHLTKDFWPHRSCPNDLVTSIKAPVHPHATEAAMYSVLFQECAIHIILLNK